MTDLLDPFDEAAMQHVEGWRGVRLAELARVRFVDVPALPKGQPMATTLVEALSRRSERGAK